MAEQVMDEVVASCMVCGKQRKLAIWNTAGAGVCSPCQYKATAEPHGYVLHHPRRGGVFRSHIYLNWTDARKALEGMVWHSRDGWEIRPVMIGAPTDGGGANGNV